MEAHTVLTAGFLVIDGNGRAGSVSLMDAYRKNDVGQIVGTNSQYVGGRFRSSTAFVLCTSVTTFNVRSPRRSVSGSPCRCPTRTAHHHPVFVGLHPVRALPTAAFKIGLTWARRRYRDGLDPKSPTGTFAGHE